MNAGSNDVPLSSVSDEVKDEVKCIDDILIKTTDFIYVYYSFLKTKASSTIRSSIIRIQEVIQSDHQFEYYEEEEYEEESEDRDFSQVRYHYDHHHKMSEATNFQDVQDVAFLCIIIGGSGSIIVVITILGAAWKCKKSQLQKQILMQKQRETTTTITRTTTKTTTTTTTTRDNKGQEMSPGIHANIRKGGQFTVSLSLPSVAEERNDKIEWVNDKVVKILNDPFHGMPQKWKKTANEQEQLLQLLLMQQQRQESIYNLSQLNIQNLAIHQTLMNESSGISMKQQILQNYMNDLAQNEGYQENDKYFTDSV